MVILLLVACWLPCSIICAGLFFAHVRKKYSQAGDSPREDLGMAVAVGSLYGIIGPLGVVIAFLLTGFAEHGWRLRP